MKIVPVSHAVLQPASQSVPNVGARSESRGLAVLVVDDSCGGSCPADLDDDNNVGITDFLALLAQWGFCTLPCPPTCPADFDGDCFVGITDFLELLASWGPC